MAVANRLNYIDLLRGWAIILMFETHAYNAWCNPEAKKSAFYMYTRMVGGMAAPLFLFLAGISLVFMQRSLLRKGFGHYDVSMRLLKRGLWIFAAAFLFRAQSFLFQWGAAKPAALLRVDILNCIGLSLILLALLLSTPDRGRLWLAACGAAIIVFSTPLVYDLPLREHLPRLLADYLTGRPPAALFPLFPWMAFTVAGAAIGLLLARSTGDPLTHRRFCILLGAGSATMIALAVLINRMPVRVYPTYDFWLTSPQYFAIRLGVMGLLISACYCWRAMRPHPWFSALEQLGRHSLLLYWVHVELVYGRLFGGLKGRQSIASASWWLLALTAAMLALSFLPDLMKRRRLSTV